MISGGVPGGAGTTIRMALEGNGSAWTGVETPSPNAKNGISTACHLMRGSFARDETCQRLWDRPVPSFSLLESNFREAARAAGVPVILLFKPEFDAKPSVLLHDLSRLGRVHSSLRGSAYNESPSKKG